jgi:putative hydroxymethylpyrimidine transport system substrate-binding protein
MTDSRRRGVAVLCAVVLTIGLAACGSDDDASGGSASNPQPFTLVLDWYVNPDHAGIYTALDRGFFKQAGLDVNPQVPSDPAAPIKEVAAGRVDLAVSYEPEVLLAHEQGLEVEAVAAVVDSPLTSLIAPRTSPARPSAPRASHTRATTWRRSSSSPGSPPRPSRRSTSASTCCRR